MSRRILKPGPVAVAALLSVALLPAAVSAQFDVRDPQSVGIAILPFTVEYSEDRKMASDMARVLRSKLPRQIGHPVYTARDVLPAVEEGVPACLADRYCIPFMGDQFNVSLVAHVSMSKLGEDLNLEVDFYATGNGLRFASKSSQLRVGDDPGLVRVFSGWVNELFEVSLLVSAENLAGEGGVVGGESGEEERLAAEFEATRRKKKTSRREEATTMREAPMGFDRSDPTAALRAVAEGAEGVEDVEMEPRTRREEPRPRRSRKSEPSYESDYDFDSPDEEGGFYSSQSRTKSEHKSKRRDNSRLSLDARQNSGRSVASYSDAQRAGLGTREYKRFTHTGLTMEAFLKRRWAHGRRFHLRVGGFYGFGWLTRRYATIIYIPATGLKTEEYAWESLGFAPDRNTEGDIGNPGFNLGVGYAPLDFLQVELDVSVMIAQQGLRNEFVWQGSDVPTNRGEPVKTKRSAHVLLDLRARFFANPKGRVKFSPGLGMTMVFMEGYEDLPGSDAPREWSSRPVATMVGLTPLLGVTAALSPYLSLYVDVLPTIVLHRGAARYEELQFFSGETERNGLAESDLNPPLEGCGASQGEGFSSCPLFFRIGAGTMIMF